MAEPNNYKPVASHDDEIPAERRMCTIDKLQIDSTVLGLSIVFLGIWPLDTVLSFSFQNAHINIEIDV